MPPSLRITLLGKPQFVYDQQSLTADLVSAKGQALLIYLAVTRQAHSRTALAGLLWGGMPEETARANLRLTLTKLRKFLPETVLQSSRFDVELGDFWLDVTELEKTLKSGKQQREAEKFANLEVILDLYRGDFLDDFQLLSAHEFDEWTLVQRERLRQKVVTTLTNYLQTAVPNNDYQNGIPAARKLLTLEPWLEEGHYHLMHLLALSGQRSAALAQYETCCRLLAEELGIEPSSETVALYDKIKAGEIAKGGGEVIFPRSSSPINNLPRSLTSFIGRQAELKHLQGQLLDPYCRLLTIMGIGGMGKTRLAVELATAVAPHFADGVTFVDLSSLEDAGLLVTAVTDALNLPLTDNISPEAQLTYYLSTRHLLLLLDNFETVLDGASLISNLLSAAPQLTLLVTSREPLNLNGEWLYPLSGLTLPTETGNAKEAFTDVLAFFADCARRVVPQFTLEGELPDILELCQLTDGMPLALELAVSWVKVLTVAEIVTEIRQNLDILKIRQVNRPERHHSIQAVLEQTWQRLSLEEQETFARLTIFQGAFDRKAAQRVTDADLSIITHLMDKALLQRRQLHYYTIHPLVRQFGYGRLQANPTALVATQAAYAATYADFCHSRLPQLLQHDLPTLATLKQEQDNIRAVWEWAIAQQEIDVLAKLVQPLAIYLNHYSYNQEYYQRFQTAVTVLTPLSEPAAQPVLAYALLELGNAHMTLGKLSDADVALQASEAIYSQYAIPHAPGHSTDPTAIRAIVAWMRSDFAAAIRFGDQALAQAGQNKANEAYAHFVLSGVHVALGQYQTAQAHARQAFELALSQNDPRFLGYCHMELGKSAMALADYAAADDHFEMAFVLPQKIGNLSGMAMARVVLGESQRRQQKWIDSEQAFAEAWQIYQEIHHHMGLARACQGLGDAATGLGQWAKARDLYVQGLQLVVAAGLQNYANMMLAGVGEWLLAMGLSERAMTVLTAVAQDPQVNADLKKRVLAQLVDAPPTSLSPPKDTLQLAATLIAELEEMIIHEK